MSLEAHVFSHAVFVIRHVVPSWTQGADNGRWNCAGIKMK
jgi:hypothetical protein